MAEKDNSMRLHVVINGSYTPVSGIAGISRRVYRYHVDIRNAALGQQVAFDRELYICEQRQQAETTVSRPATEQRPATAVIDKSAVPTAQSVEANTGGVTAQTPTVTATATAPLAGQTPLHNINAGPVAPVIGPIKKHAQTAPEQIPHIENQPEQSTKVSQPITMTTPEPSAEPTSAQKAIVDPPVIKTRMTDFLHHLSRFKDRLLETRDRIRGVVPGVRRRIVLPNLRPPPTRRIFSTPAGRHTRKSLLLTGIITLAVLLFYFFPPDTAFITSKYTTVESNPASEEETAPNGYHAVIEQQPDGVVITIQGPDHEAILTKLPPGYHPVVQDNKIVHIVTPGNTLWFIAKRYIKNPYRYPELARLNKIKNPDLIYPGDRVVIQHIRKP